MKLLLIVRIDKPKGTLADGEACFGNLMLEVLDGHTRSTDVHQFVDDIARGTAQFQHGLIEGAGQQMDEGKFGSMANTDLLMSPERVLPCRKAQEHDAVSFQKLRDAKKELSFARGGDVLNHVVDEYEVVAFVRVFGRFGEKKIHADESPLLLACCKERLGFVDAALADVDACHLATLFGERKQIAALAASDFQNACVC